MPPPPPLLDALSAGIKSEDEALPLQQKAYLSNEELSPVKPHSQPGAAIPVPGIQSPSIFNEV
jgi:hypothetical protein